jgi:hypothetical protein
LKLPAGVARLRFGGGGGAGETNDGNSSGGGAGGGVVFARAPKLSGIGNVVARGLGGDTTALDGAGGGGAGGTVYLDLTDVPRCAKIGVTGGVGGDTGDGSGPGGGGGGGLLFFRDALRDGGPEAATVESQAGVAGRYASSLQGALPADPQRSAPPFAGIVSPDMSP